MMDAFMMWHNGGKNCKDIQQTNTILAVCVLARFALCEPSVHLYLKYFFFVILNLLYIRHFVPYLLLSSFSIPLIHPPISEASQLNKKKEV